MDVGQVLQQLKQALFDAIPHRVAAEHGGRELYAVCLSYGLGQELLPPAVIGCRVEDFEALNVVPGAHWDAGPLWDLREPIHFDQDDESIVEPSRTVVRQLDDDGVFERVEAMLVDLSRELTMAKWPESMRLAPGFVVYAANVEDGAWQWQLDAAVNSETRRILEEKGWLEPVSMRANRFDVELTTAGSDPREVVRALRQHWLGGWAEQPISWARARALVAAAPVVVGRDLAQVDVKKVTRAIEAAGGCINVRTLK